MTDESPRYHRLESPTQTADTAKLQEQSGEIWGRTPQGGREPAVQAYLGPLPPGKRGIEFTTGIPPNPGSPPRIKYWSGPRSGVRVEEGYAIISVVITRNTQI